MFIVAKRLDGSRWHLAWRWASVQATLCWMGTQLSSQKWDTGSQFSTHFYCDQRAGCITIPLGTEVGLSLGDIVLDGDQAPPKKAQPHRIFGRCLLWPNGWMDQDATWYGGGPWPKRRCVRWGPSCPQKGYSLQFSDHVYCGQTAGWMKTPLVTEVDFGPGHIVLDGDPAPAPPPRKGHSSRLFSAYVGHGRPFELLLSSCANGRPKTLLITKTNFLSNILKNFCGNGI